MKKFVKELRIVVGLIAESASFAFFSIKSDKLRTFLSLFGVTVGIFSIVAVFCAVDSPRSSPISWRVSGPSGATSSTSTVSP